MRAALIALAAVACRDAGRPIGAGPSTGGAADAHTPPGLDTGGIPDAVAVRRTSTCSDAWNNADALWSAARGALTAALRDGSSTHVRDRVILALEPLRQQDKGLTYSSFVAGSGSVAVFARYSCGALALGGRLWLISDRPTAPEISAEERVADDELASMEDLGSGAIALHGHRFQSRLDVSSLRIVRLDAGQSVVLFARSGMLDLDTRDLQQAAPAFRWSEPMRRFGATLSGPTRTFEGTVDLGRGRVEVIPTAPWLEQLDAACAPGPRGLSDRGLCSEDTFVESVRVVGDYAAIVLHGDGTDTDCGGEAPVSMVAADRSLVVELGTDRLATWSIVDVRPEDRGCATTVRPYRRTRTVGRVVARGANVAADRGAVSWTHGDALVRGGRQTLVGDTASSLAVDDQTTAWISAETGNLRTQEGDGPVTTLLQGMWGASLTLSGHAPIWTDFATGEVRTWNGGAVRVVARGLAQPWGVARWGDGVLVATTTGISRVTMSGQVSPLDVPALAPIAVAADGTRVAWTEAGGRVMIAVPGQPAHVVATGGRPWSIAIDGPLVYWSDASDGTIRSARPR